MKPNTVKHLKELIKTYNHFMAVVEHKAKKADQEEERAYGGFMRMAKGQMQEYIAEELIKIAWECELGKNKSRLDINSKKIKIPIKLDYVRDLKDKVVRKYILAHIKEFSYGLSVDKHVFIDGKFVLGVESKAYAENAMLKRILVDFLLLKTKFKDLKCMLLQLESQLGGSYSTLKSRPPYGSMPTHALMSYFKNVDLHIVTLLEGERKVDQPINKKKFFKPLKIKHLNNALKQIISCLPKK